jgi:hypothetical protein
VDQLWRSKPRPTSITKRLMGVMGILRDQATISGQYFTEVNKGGVNMSALQS